MPLKRDEQGGGTDAGGAKTTVYCSHCYQRGHVRAAEPDGRADAGAVAEKLGSLAYRVFCAGSLLAPFQSSRLAAERKSEGIAN